MSEPQKTLVIAPAWLGDMLMSQPLYSLLHAQDHEIDVLAPPSTYALATRMPEIKHAIKAPLQHGQLQLGTRWQLGKQLRKTGYQRAIILPNSLKSALIPWFAGIAKRTGWLGEHRYGLLNDHRKLDTNTYPGLIARYAALGLTDGAAQPTLKLPQLKIDIANQQTCTQRLNLSTDKPILALCPGAEYGPAKRWPAKYYAKIAQHYLAKQWQVWIFGTANEQAAAQTILQETEGACTDLTGKTNLLEAIDLLALSRAAVCNDSGLMHLAAAVQVPLVAVYGSTSPTYTPPAGEQAKIIRLGLACSPCFKRECPLSGNEHLACLTGIKPAQVLSALEALLP
jgi:heptosyltransferase-2